VTGNMATSIRYEDWLDGTICSGRSDCQLFSRRTKFITMSIFNYLQWKVRLSVVLKENKIYNYCCL
jgi:hypothetical protein